MVALVDIERPLALFAEGIAGHYCHLKVGEEDAADRGGVYLPGSIELFEDELLNAAIYRLRVLVQLGFREFGTYAFDIGRARTRIPALAARPLPSLHRESDLTVFFDHFEAPPVARWLFHVIESARVEAQTLCRYPGACKYQEALDPHRDPPAEFLRPAIDRVRVADATVYDTAEAVVECYDELADRLAADPGEAELGVTPGQMEWAQREVRLEDWESELDDVENRVAAMEVAELTGADEVKVTEGKGDGDVRDVGRDLVRMRDELQRRVGSERSMLRQHYGEAPRDARSFLYDEWDYLARRYRKGWCRLFEIDIDSAAAENGDARRLMRSVRPYARAVRRRFEQIRPIGYQRTRKVADGDELDLGALVDARSDVRAGVSPDDRVYSQRKRTRRDVNAAFLVDLSASTDDPVEDHPSEPATLGGPPQDLRDPWFDDDTFERERPSTTEQKRRIIDIQKEAVALMAMALEGIGDEYGVYGFSGYGRDCVEFYVAKEFDEPFRRRALDAIAAMKPKRSTRMGPAIRHAAAKLAAAGSALKVLMIVSDGFPQDCDYGPERGNHEYGLRDTAKALEEAENAGVHTFCVTVDRSGHDYLRRMCPETHYMVIEETGGLPAALQKAYRQLTQI